jgi:superfamily II DNA or RNA helicase
MFEGIKAGKYRAIVNIGVLTTGFDAPVIDCVCWLRPTQSASLFIQMGGRGLRIHPGKENCLMLDMAGNFDRFKSLEMPFSEAKRTKEEEQGAMDGGEPPMKQCDICETVIPASARVCGFCGFMFTGELTNKAFTGHQPTLDEYIAKRVEIIGGLKTKTNRPCVKIKYFVEERKYPIVQTYVNDFKYPSQVHKKTLNRIAGGKKPHRIKVTKNERGYDEVEIWSWTRMDEISTAQAACEITGFHATQPPGYGCELCAKFIKVDRLDV